MGDNCKEHTGQVLWFYCKTCDVPICRDCTVVEHPPGSHELVKINAVITGQREEIKKLAETCKIVEKNVEEAFKQLHPMRENIVSSCNAACMAIDEKNDEVQRSLLQSVQKQADDLKVTVAGMKSIREKATNAYEEELQMLKSRLKTALTTASQLTSEGSDCDVASVYKHLTTTLQQLGQITAPSIDVGSVRFQEKGSLNVSCVSECIGRIEETEIIHPSSGRSVYMKKQWNAPWKMVKKFGDTGEGKLYSASGVTINQDGDVAVVDCTQSKVYVYNIENGNMKMSIDTKQTSELNSLEESYPSAVVMYQGHYIVSDRTYFPAVYDNKGEYIRQLKSNIDTRGIAINSQGHVLVGHDRFCHIEILSYADGKKVGSLKTPIKAWFIAVSKSSDDKIVISGNGAQVIDSEGHTIHVLRPPSDVTSGWHPTGVCTIFEGDEEEVFICNGDLFSLSSGIKGVYRFSLTTGKYLGCVTTEVSSPDGIEFTEDGRLVVADNTCVKVFAPAE